MSRVQLVLPLDVLESLKVQMKNELISDQIVSPMLKSSDDGKELLVIS